MGISTQRVKLDIGKQASMQVIRLGQCDMNGTTLVAELYDGGSPYSLSGKTARFTMRTPDRQSSYSVASSSTSNNTATFNIDERYAAGVAGTTDVAYVEVLSGSTVICSTSRMRVICLQSATEGVSPSQMHDNGLDAAIAAANAAASSANTAASNANTKASRAETATTSANTARDNANTAASAANAAASAATTAAGSATTAAESANSAKDAANAAATAANTAAGSANAATSEANAAIEAMGDISELAVPEMTANVRGGAKVGGSTQVIGGKLEVKLSESDTGTSVTTGSTSALRELQVHGKSIQDGTPTPDAPVPVQVVGGANVWHESVREVGVPYTNVGITWTKNADGTYTANGTATANAWAYAGTEQAIVDMAIPLAPGTYTASTNAQRCALRKVSGGAISERVNEFVSYTFTVNDGESIFICPQVPNGVEVTNETYYVQIVPGSNAFPYVPYGFIGIVVGDTVTPIDLQGNTLASLPNGTRDELHVDSSGHVVLEKRTGIAVVDGSTKSYANMAAPSTGGTGNQFSLIVDEANGGSTNAERTNVLSSVAVANSNALHNNSWNVGQVVMYKATSHVYLYTILPATISTVADANSWAATALPAYTYPLKTPHTIDLGYITPPAIPSGSVVTVSALLTPTFDLACWTEHASELADMTATLANEISSLRAQIAALATS